MLHTVLRRRASSESVDDSQPDLIIPTGKREGRNPSAAATPAAQRPRLHRDAAPRTRPKAMRGDTEAEPTRAHARPAQATVRSFLVLNLYLFLAVLLALSDGTSMGGGRSGDLFGQPGDLGFVDLL